MTFPTFDSEDQVPEAFREAYEEKDGVWKPKITEDTTLAEEGKRALDSMKAERKAEKERADKAEADLAELKRTVEAKDSGISEEELQKIRDAEAARWKPVEEERDQLKAENRKLKLTDRVQALALKHGVMPDRIEDAMLILGRRTDLTDSDGIAVKDKEGNVTAEKVDEFLATTFKEERPWLYGGTGASGGGSAGSEGSGGPAGDYDPVKAGKEAAAEQKKGQEASGLAFS